MKLTLLLENNIIEEKEVEPKILAQLLFCNIIVVMQGTYNTQKAIIWLCLAHLIVDVYSGFLNPIMPFIAEKLQFSMATATVIISISHICSSMLQPIFGFFADNILKRFVIFLGLILASVFVPLTPVVTTIPLLLVCMILGSIGNSFFHPQSIGFVNYFSGKDCANNMGVFISLGSFGFALGPLLAAYITQILGLDKILYTSLFGLILAFLMFFFVPKLSKYEEQPRKKSFLVSFKEILSNKQINYLMLISMMKTLVTNSCCILLPFLWKSIGHTPFYIGLSLFLFVFLGSIASLLSPKAERLWGAKTILYISMCATLPQIIIFALIYKSHPVLSMVIFGLIGFTTMLAQPVTLVLAQKALPQYRSIIAGFINGFCWGIIALCLSILGSFAQNFGIINVLIFLSIIPVICSKYVSFIKE